MEHIDNNKLFEKIDKLELLIKSLNINNENVNRDTKTKCELSFISPCYNEEENLHSLYKRIISTCEQYKIVDFEIIWVENGSSDNSIAVMEEIAKFDTRLKIIQLTRNYGYTGAISCGLEHSVGEYTAILDGDIQDPPELIPEMYNKAKNEGYDVVYGVKKTRQENLLKKSMYKIFYRLWKYTADINIPVDAGEFSVMHRSVVDSINSMPERGRFIRGLRAWVGFKQTGYSYDRDARVSGESKFNLYGMVQLALDGIFSYSVFPLRAMSIIGIIVSFLSIIISLIQGILKIVSLITGEIFIGVLPSGMTQTNLFTAIMFGMTIMSIGIIGEYIGRIYTEVKERPLYLIKKSLNKK